LNNNDQEAVYTVPDVKLQAIHLSRYYALSFLAERGELTPSKIDQPRALWEQSVSNSLDDPSIRL
jgi:hypothetical protein